MLNFIPGRYTVHRFNYKMIPSNFKFSYYVVSFHTSIISNSSVLLLNTVNANHSLLGCQILLFIENSNSFFTFS
jgi:hypothetical protein